MTAIMATSSVDAWPFAGTNAMATGKPSSTTIPIGVATESLPLQGASKRGVVTPR
jgi:hypothetical protein